ncbi:MAG: biotin carboxylase N-terminal domain-containing protein [Calditrichia bacterium]
MLCERAVKWVLLPLPYFPEADRRAPHVLAADEAYCIGPAVASESYLKMDTIIDVAKMAVQMRFIPVMGFWRKTGNLRNA